MNAQRYCRFALLSVAALGLAGCVSFNGWQGVQGSGNVTTEVRPLISFDRVSLGSSGELRLVQGDEESLKIETDDNLLPLIHSEVSNGRLSIGSHNVNLRPTRTIRYELKLKNLAGLQLSGSLNANADTIRSDRLALGISGSGNIRIAHLEAQSVSTHISGSGSMSVAGRAEKQVTDISGSGSLRAAELKCAQAEVHVSGSGDVSIWVTESLKARISGSGSVEYKGRPMVDAHTSGSGRVHHRSGGE
jgi:hypothetical protein